MAFNWLYGSLLWASVALIALCVVYGIAYLYKVHTGKSLQSNKYAFVALIVIISLLLVALGIYFSNKLGILYEFKIIAKVAGLVIGVFMVAKYLLKKYKKENK